MLKPFLRDCVHLTSVGILVMNRNETDEISDSQLNAHYVTLLCQTCVFDCFCCVNLLSSCSWSKRCCRKVCRSLSTSSSPLGTKGSSVGTCEFLFVQSLSLHILLQLNLVIFTPPKKKCRCKYFALQGLVRTMLLS